MSGPITIHRALPVEDVSLQGNEGRTVTLKLLSYGRDYTVSDDGQHHYTERWRAGAFKRSLNHGHGEGLALTYEHDVPGLPRALPVGGARRVWEDGPALMLEGRISRTSTGDDLVELLRDGVIRGVSVVANVHRSVPFVGGHERSEASLRSVAFTTVPQYDDAELVAMRSEPPEVEAPEVEAPSTTPLLDGLAARLDVFHLV